jgi:nucleoside-triphosphatase THEP1
MTDVIRAPISSSRDPVLLTGKIHIGKTTVCQSVIARARQQGWRVAGLLSPTVFDSDGQRIAVQMIDLATDEKRTLARLNQDLGGPQIGPYRFDSETLTWGHHVLTRAIDRGCDLLVIDEIGRLELEQDSGLDVAPLLAERLLPLSLIVVRKPLLHLFYQKLPGLKTSLFEVSEESRTSAPARVAELLGLR